jgi:cytochrome c55X
MTLKGGLGPSLLPEALAGKDEADLAAIVLHGVPGTPMPPWGIEISPAEAAWFVARLKQGLAP